MKCSIVNILDFIFGFNLFVLLTLKTPLGRNTNIYIKSYNFYFYFLTFFKTFSGKLVHTQNQFIKEIIYRFFFFNSIHYPCVSFPKCEEHLSDLRRDSEFLTVFISADVCLKNRCTNNLISSEYIQMHTHALLLHAGSGKR